MPASTASSSAPASQTRMSTENGSCFGALFKACRRSKSVSLDADYTDEFEKNPHFKKITEEEFHKLYKVKKTIGVGGLSPQNNQLVKFRSTAKLYYGKEYHVVSVKGDHTKTAGRTVLFQDFRL